MSKELVISSNRHETRVALLEDDQLVEVYFQRANEYSLAGSIHKGRVTRVLPGMQSAFVDLGLERDTFLYVSDFLEEEHEDIDRVTGDERPPRENGRESSAIAIAIGIEIGNAVPRCVPRRSPDHCFAPVLGARRSFAAAVDAAAVAADGRRPRKSVLRTDAPDRSIREIGQRIATAGDAAHAAAAIADADSPSRSTPRSDRLLPRPLPVAARMPAPKPSHADRPNLHAANARRRKLRRKLHWFCRASRWPSIAALHARSSRRSLQREHPRPAGSRSAAAAHRRRARRADRADAYSRSRFTIRRRTRCPTLPRTPRRMGRFLPRILRARTAAAAAPFRRRRQRAGSRRSGRRGPVGSDHRAHAR